MSNQKRLREVFRYSESFKREFVRRWEQGEYSSLEEALRVSGVRGHNTVKKWIAAYGAPGSLPKTIRIETMSEKNELKEAKGRIKQLESALSEMTMRTMLEEEFLKIACEGLGTDVDSFKKKRVIDASNPAAKQAKDKGLK